jgi:hypothetical protein
MSFLMLGLMGIVALLFSALVAVPVMLVSGILWLVLLPVRLVGLMLGSVFHLIWWLCGVLLPSLAVGGIALAIGVAAGGTVLGIGGAAAPVLLVLLGLWVCYRAMNPRARAA